MEEVLDSFQRILAEWVDGNTRYVCLLLKGKKLFNSGFNLEWTATVTKL